MGRQPHVTRLALGRSPFGPPLRDENGDFILGPRAHDNDVSGYTQQFDSRGHPQNQSSKAASRKLRKAQNDVLATVGVVVKNGEERKSKWERLEDTQKLDIIDDENEAGGFLLMQGRILGVLLPWSMVSLRKRLMAFNSYYVLPVASLAAKEYSILGLSSILFAGIPFQLLSSIPIFIRYYSMSPSVDAIINYANPWRSEPVDLTKRALAERLCIMSLLRCIEFPTLVYVTLQTLQIVPLTTIPDWRSYLPFSLLSPFIMPMLPPTLDAQSIASFAVTLLQTPFSLYLVHDYLKVQIGYRLYGMLRQIAPKPDRPDTISIKSSDDRDEFGEALIPGIGCPWFPYDPRWERGKRYFGPKSFFGVLRLAFPPIYKALNTLSRGRLARSRGRLTPLLDRQLRTTVRYRYWYDRADLAPVPRRGSPEDIAFRHRIVNSIFNLANMDPIEELVDVESWTNDVLGPKADVLRVQAPLRQTWDEDSSRPAPFDASQSERIDTGQYSETVSNLIAEAFRVVPQSDAVIIQASDGEVVMFSQQASTDTTNVAEMDNIHTLQATEVPLEALIQGMRELQPDAEQIPHPDTGGQRDPTAPAESSTRPVHAGSPPPTPTPGISRARSLTDAQTQTAVPPTLRPLRRPTETDDSLAAMAETVRAEAEARQSSRPPQPDPPSATESQQQTLNQTIENETELPEAPLMPMKHRQFRVTILSNHAVDSLAWHASSILTSLVLWPVEAMWLRSVALWAVQNPAMGPYVDPWWAARLGFGVIGRPIGILGLGTWFGGADTAAGRARYMASILITLGLEGIVRGALWEVGLWSVKRWRGMYGWGQF